jgi:hypothetical protein
MTKINCDHCGKELEKPTGAVNRSRIDGKPIYCDKTCFGLANRSGKTEAQKIEEKRLYDIDYRRRNPEERAIKRAASYQKNRNPEKERVARKKRAPQHAAYCRTPEYKAWKKEYDKKHLAKKKYGEYWESFLINQELQGEIYERMTAYEIALQNKTLNKSQERKRHEQRINSGKLEGRTLGHA